jgi:hypothetical protein
MKYALLLAVLLSVHTAQAAVSIEKLVDMVSKGILLNCDMNNMCTDLQSGEVYEPLGMEYPRGTSLVFPPDMYTEQEIQEAAPYIVKYYRKLGLIKE